MECPICLDPLFHTIILDYGHRFCKECYEKSEITKCPCCRREITIITEAPYLDSRMVGEVQNEDSSTLREIVDPRGYDLISKASRLRSKMTEITSDIEKISIESDRKEQEEIASYEQKVSILRNQHNEHITEDTAGIAKRTK